MQVRDVYFILTFVNRYFYLFSVPEKQVFTCENAGPSQRKAENLKHGKYAFISWCYFKSVTHWRAFRHNKIQPKELIVFISAG